MDNYKNIFFYYRGPSANDPMADSDIQIENNTTKALIITLERSGIDLQRSFFQKFLSETIQSDTEFNYILQQRQGKSQPDAIIEVNGKPWVIIEAKTHAKLDIQQLLDHAEEWMILMKKPKQLVITCWAIDQNEVMKVPNTDHCTWRQIHEFFLEHYRIINDSINKFLIKQFMEYLEMANLEFNPMSERRWEPTWRIGQLNYFVKDHLKRLIDTDSQFKTVRKYLTVQGKYSGYTGIQLGKARAAHYNINFQSDSIGVTLTLFGVKLTEDLRIQIKKFVADKLEPVRKNASAKRVTLEQARLWRYELTACGYRSCTKMQNDLGFQTFVHSVNIFQLGMNSRSFDRQTEYIDQFFETYDKTRKLGAIKQIDLSFKIRINPDVSGGEKKWREDDIRFLDSQLLANPDTLARECANFISQTQKIAKISGLRNVM